jgi:glutamyl-tRNA reductase
MDVAPTIAAIRRKAESIREAELKKTLSHLQDLTPKQQKSLELMTAAIINKLLHDPILFLKAESQPAQKQKQLDMVRGLFGLDCNQAAPDRANDDLWPETEPRQKSIGS